MIRASVTAARVIRGDLVVPVVAEGTIRARSSADIRTGISARIRRFYAEEGQVGGSPAAHAAQPRVVPGGSIG
ncbi:MAG: hypothetical protein ACE5G2_01035 [Candidatus Krumholzibacteriia bacterium]